MQVTPAAARNGAGGSRDPIEDSFDGDEMNLMLILDQHQYSSLSRLAPEYSVLDLQKTRTISKINAIPKPVIATIGNWQRQNRT